MRTPVGTFFTCFTSTQVQVLTQKLQTLEPGKKQKRHFRYRSREGDFFVKVVLTGEPVDNRCDDEKEDAGKSAS